MKKKTASIIFVALFITLISIISVQAKTQKKAVFNFDEITDEECLSFVNRYNIVIPERLIKLQLEVPVTKRIMQSVYSDPEYSFSYNYDKMQEYAEAIQQVIVENYICKNSGEKARYALQNSKVKDANGNWVTSGGYFDNRWLNYNCYGFALHRIEQPGFYYSVKQYQPGDMADDENGPGAINTVANCLTSADLASLVKKDLLAMGFSNVQISDYPMSVSASQELICVRLAEDYHFMRYDQATGAWYHKPGLTAVLKYNGTPNNGDEWDNERSRYGVEHEGDTTYDGDIKFIRYDTNMVVLSSGASSVSYSLQVKKGKDSFLEIENTSSRLYRFVLGAGSSVKAKLYNSEMELINTYSGSSIAFNYSLSSGKYYLELSYSNPNAYGSVNINISAHSHNYGAPYQWKSYTQHLAICGCGLTKLQAHAISSSSYGSGQQYATCLLCGGLASIGITNRGLSVESLPHTANGSFKLPNGVVILVDDDMDAFLDDTLVFIESDDSVLKN